MGVKCDAGWVMRLAVIFNCLLPSDDDHQCNSCAEVVLLCEAFRMLDRHNTPRSLCVSVSGGQAWP